MIDNKHSISVVTATYNAVDVLPQLIESLRAQEDKDFQWVVADGASNDGTLELLSKVTDLNLLVLSQPDFGIYDALNRAINASSGEYYIVSGADDAFYSHAIAEFKAAIVTSSADMIMANINFGEKLLKPKKSAVWLWGFRTYVAGHTVATAFKKDLHQRFGFYSKKYPLAADQYFVMKAYESGIKTILLDSIVGKMGTDGISAIDMIGNATEVFRIQIALGRSKLLPGFVLLLRLLRAR